MAHTNPRRLDCLRLYKYMVTCSRLLPRQGSDYYLRYGRQVRMNAPPRALCD